jgi:uncharacterized membrane protein
MRILTHTNSRSSASAALDNLRGAVILIVLGFHSALAYVNWNAARTADFDSPPESDRRLPDVAQ